MGTRFALYLCVTLPRYTKRERETLLITRRCIGRQYLLRPDRDTNQIFLYCLAVAAKEHGMEVHAVIVMSNHFHLVVTDHFAKRSDFTRDLVRNVAKCIQALRGTRGGVFDKNQANFTRLVTADAVVERCAYTLVNPVADALVSSANKWPGVTVDIDDIGRRTFHIKRPKYYCRKDNPTWPQQITLQLTVPPDHAPDEFRRALRAEVREQQELAREKVRSAGKRFLGRQRVLDTSPYKRAQSYEDFGTCVPTFAVGKGQREAFKHAAAELKVFRAMYRDAIKAWKKGVRDVLFPEGTWWMVHFHQVGTVSLQI